jgi:hypothetical protein
VCTIDPQGVVDIFDRHNIGLADDFLYPVLKNCGSILQKLEDVISDRERYDRT